MKKLYQSRLAGILKGTMVSLLALCSGIPALAAEEMHLMVDLKSGTTEKFVLSGKPVLSFSDTECTFRVGDDEVIHSMSDIARAYFAVAEPGPSEVSEIKDDIVTVDLSVPGQITVRDIAPDTPVAVYDTDGRKMARATAGHNRTATVDINALPANAVYVVSVSNSKNFKIYKR